MSIIIKPIITEKANLLSEKSGVYCFHVQVDANKIQIKKAIEDAYGVTVENVNTVIMPAKRIVKYTKAGMIEGKKPKYKKAYVQVRSGEIINIYENI
ncbi:50S ribosomal protein L23 [Schleiferia thermophila]|jgi:large subunit ribosomal protein L23|uniref:Large ribosomal subunit protein uL23 n=1 Tax=Schleiferia thermophila TaxID=884107 RepID=A0A369A6Q2_9FLAO|nr:50S ribosomal protein L23 [Schleiferia thermophila]KFD38365.1 50S ribosomal protein L23 [Schleiferia thermophila str. Yellowstone]RCX04821.1 large subunit ribosomal protein L23 [Schleiferia thermophila]GCD79652.1 50S ribosomal protein L23 [Schleiferia thermophila]